MTMCAFRGTRKECEVNMKLDPNKIPSHVALILDGNGRWAKKRLMPRTFGHRKGAQNVLDIASECNNLGIKYITLFCFSSVTLKMILSGLSLPSFPLLPVPLSEAVIGSIVAIALAKGIDGLKLKVVGQVVVSWVAAPLTAGFFCYMFLYLSKLIESVL